jgi:DNA-binding MarR family transcriptional regulator
MELQSRPLTSRDVARYVARPADDAVRRAVEAQDNVLLSAIRGAGATSLLYRLEGELPDAAYLNAEPAAEPVDVLTSVAARLGLSRSPIPDMRVLTAWPDPLAPPPGLKELQSALRRENRHPAILIDGPLNAKVAFELFGRWRDEVFAIGATWVVVAHHERLAEYLTPPADVFFDVVVPLEPLSPAQALEILSRRDTSEMLAPEAREAIVETFDGTPRHLLRLARQHATAGERDSADSARAHAAATANLSRGAHMLLAEMQGRGPVAATDETLHNRLGVTPRQIRRNLQELSEKGLVEVVPGGRGTPGRPPTTFQLTEIGRIPPGAI